MIRAKDRFTLLRESLVETAVRGVIAKAGLKERATCHTFNQSFATVLLKAGYGMQAVQALSHHSDVKTTMIYTECPQSCPMGCS